MSFPAIMGSEVRVRTLTPTHGKCILTQTFSTNYAPVLKAQGRARSRGFSDVLYLNSVDNRNLEEASSCNIFIVKDGVISTPKPNGSILEGITRKSIIDVARDLGYQVEERSIPVDDLMDAEEVICSGTAVGVTPVGSITYQNKSVQYKMDVELVCRRLYSTLTGIYRGTVEDKWGWVV